MTKFKPGKELIFTDNNGREVDLIALYQNILIPKWEQERTDEMLKVARKDYPGVSSLKELIEKTAGRQLSEIPYLIMHLLVCMLEYLHKDTKKKFKPKMFQDFASPQILTYDIAQRLRNKLACNKLNKEDWLTIKILHSAAVKAALTARLYTDALNVKLSEERYGKRIMELIFSKKDKDKKIALNDLKRMLDAKRKKDLPLPIEEESLGIIGETIAKKINKGRKEAPSLADFLPDGLDPVVRTKIEELLAPHRSEDAKLFSDAVVGAFRTLPNESVKKFADELRKFITKKRSPVKEISIDQELDKKDDNDKSRFTDNDRLKLASNEMEEELNSRDAFIRLEEELNKPENKKIKEFYNGWRNNPDASDADLAKSLGLHRHTVRARRGKIRELMLDYK